eukprot:TRINITY_DN1518_c2_g1_i3.p1 TRINITY_DN1518_c2_g1~~TRINITY_DN1518_c2_g1_i3.p1  ORF type:complete len:501 (-),score=213.09 TRINITY_DN1518_c2_g1_i3:910-2412(-)
MLLSLLVGFFTLLLGILRCGFLDSLVSRPMLCGFVSGSGITIAIDQLDNLLGLPANPDHNIKKFIEVCKELPLTHPLTLIIGLFSISLMLLVDFLKDVLKDKLKIPKISIFPTPALVVVVGILIGYLADVGDKGVRILGDLNAEFPIPKCPPLLNGELVATLLPSAILISIVGFVQATVVCKQYASKYGYTVSSNRELVAFGTLNIFSSFFHAWPAFTSLTRSAVGDTAGAYSQLHGFLASNIPMLSFLFLMPLFATLPKPTIAAIVIVVALKLIQFEQFYYLFKTKSWVELALAIVTFAFTILFGAQIGVIIGLGLSLLLLVKHTAMPHIAILGAVPPENKYYDIAEHKHAVIESGILVIRIDESLYFGNIGAIVNIISRIVILGRRAHPASQSILDEPIRAIVLDARNIIEIDPSAIQTLVETIDSYKSRDVFFCFVKLKKGLKERLIAGGITESSLRSIYFSNISEAVEWLRQKIPVHVARTLSTELSLSPLPQSIL